MENLQSTLNEAASLIKSIEELELSQQASLVAKAKLENNIRELQQKKANNKEAYDIATHAIEILRAVSDKQVAEAYTFLEDNINATLERMFSETTRKIHLQETSRGQYPQLEIILTVANGKKRSIKADSGHGLAQIISLISIICLIHITHSRKILVMDEIISGLSVHNREVVADILWQFTKVGFQFIVNEHGFVPKGSKVYHLEMVGDVSGVKESYIETQGVYLNSDASYSSSTSVRQQAIGRQSVEETQSEEVEDSISIQPEQYVMDALKNHTTSQDRVETPRKSEEINTEPIEGVISI